MRKIFATILILTKVDIPDLIAYLVCPGHLHIVVSGQPGLPGHKASDGHALCDFLIVPGQQGKIAKSCICKKCENYFC